MKKLTALLMAGVLCLSLSACTPQGETPEQAVEKGLTAFKNMDVPGIETYFLTPVNQGDMTELVKQANEEVAIKTLLSKLSWKIISSEVVEKDKKATVKAELTNIDMIEVLNIYMQEAMGKMLEYAFLPEAERPSEEELQKITTDILSEIIARPDNKMTTITIDINLEMVEKQWKLIADPALGDAILGGLLNAM